mmetsp:Transcript_85156/g.183604  ORF Transcript_85156/g.183604 Transcript_85156/m.183604 type:complete len:196 (-) Transcript_85156:60-647(-)
MLPEGAWIQIASNPWTVGERGRVGGEESGLTLAAAFPEDARVFPRAGSFEPMYAARFLILTRIPELLFESAESVALVLAHPRSRASSRLDWLRLLGVSYVESSRRAGGQRAPSPPRPRLHVRQSFLVVVLQRHVLPPPRGVPIHGGLHVCHRGRPRRAAGLQAIGAGGAGDAVGGPVHGLHLIAAAWPRAGEAVG